MSKCSCIENNNFDFSIDYKKDHLVFVDKSKWITAENSSPLEEFEVTIYNDNKSKKFKARVNGNTKLKYCDLPSDNECGSDGIYKFEAEICGELFSITEAVLQHIMCSYTKLLVRYNFEEYKEKIWPIFREIEYIKANANVENITEAIEHYKILKRMFEHINCKC